MSSKLSRSQGITIDQAIWLAITEQAGDDLIYLRKFAKSGILSANTKEDIWSQGGTLSYLSSAETLSIVSTDATDDVASTGARYLLISGLDGDYNFASETVVLDGTTPVVTTNTYLRIYRMRVVGAGSNESNAGTITATATSSATVQASIEIGKSVTEMCHFTIPANYVGIVIDTNISLYRSSGSGTRAGEITVEARSPIPVLGGFVMYETNQYGLNNTGTGLYSLSPRLPAVTPAKIDLKYTATPTQNSTVASLQYTMLLIKGDFTSNVSIP